MSIEGSSSQETEDGIEEGEELIDVAEYFGSEKLDEARKVRYLQLKHSTRHQNDAWPPSGLEKTLSGFAKRYSENRRHSAETEFVFLSNRPIDSKVVKTVAEAALRDTVGHPTVYAKLRGFTGLSESDFSDFCARLRLTGDQPNLWEQRGIFFEETCKFLPEADAFANQELKELVTRKATSDGAKDPCIRRVDVLRALKTDELSLFPAPCQIEMPSAAIQRKVSSDIVSQIMDAGSRPILIHAAGGIGKSVTTLQLAELIDEDSRAIIYDCFGNGTYRNPTKLRHRPREGLVQIANELAGLSLCNPLVPTSNCDTSSLFKAFTSRLKQAVKELRREHKEALLCIFIDAADNAEMVSYDSKQGHHSFARDLLRISIPDGVRIIETCRSHRIESLNPPTDFVDIQLPAFSPEETESYLKQKFPEASIGDVQEFYRLSSHNPRVQAIALSQDLALEDVLRSLGPNPTNAEDAIKSLFESAISCLRDVSGDAEGKQIDAMCSALTLLRPLVPVSVLAQIANVSESAVASFASDLGHPLRHVGDYLQFTDEPAETWFRENFRPSGQQLTAFINTLRPLADGNTYVASILPQLLLEAGELDELVSLSLSGDALPTDNPLARREVELSRLQYALKACLRARRLGDAAKLALKAGVESAGHTRQEALIRNNPDLANLFLNAESIEHYASSGMTDGEWYGSHYVYEACLLSYREELLGDARSRLRLAKDCLRSWGNLDSEERRRQQVRSPDIASFALTAYNLVGASACAQEARRWTPRVVSYQVGKRISARLVDQEKYEDLDEIASSADNDLYLILGINLELRLVQRTLPEAALRRILPMLRSHLVVLNVDRNDSSNEETVAAVTAYVESIIRLGVGGPEVWLELLLRYLPDNPPRTLTGSYQRNISPLLKAYALISELRGEVLDIMSLAHPDIRTQLEKEKDGRPLTDRSAYEFRGEMLHLLPLLQAWSRAFLSGDLLFGSDNYIPSLPEERDNSFLRNKCILLWFDVIASLHEPHHEAITAFNQWISERGAALYPENLTLICRRSARMADFQNQAHQLIGLTRKSIERSREDAEVKVDRMLGLSRAILSLDRHEAQILFEVSVEFAGKFGDEVRDRWLAIRRLADESKFTEDKAPEFAYRLARSAELIVDYCDESNFDWNGSISSIAHICPRSALAILSRWRDRSVGYPSDNIAHLIDCLVQQGKVGAVAALPMICIQSKSDEYRFLDRALISCEGATQVESLAKFVHRYFRLIERSQDDWKRFADVLEKNGVSVPEIDAEIKEYLSAQVKIPERKIDSLRYGVRPEQDDDSNPLDQIWSDADLLTPEGCRNVLQRYDEVRKESYHRTDPERFYALLFSKVSLGKEVDFVRTIAESDCLSWYELKYFFGCIPAAWLERVSITRALEEMLKNVARKYCYRVTRNAIYDTLPIVSICERCGFDLEAIIDESLAALGHSPDFASGGRLFTLIGLIAPKLNASEASEALDLALYAVEEVAEAENSDGEWSPNLMPLSTVEQCLSGYIWGCLGAVDPPVRWQAAHVVRGLCEFGNVEMLSSLVEFSRDESRSMAFSDQHLVFYQFHAIQWFTMTLARVAKERPDTVAGFSEFLLEQIQPSQRHVMVRHFAKQALATLLDVGILAEESRAQVESVNQSTLPVVQSQEHVRTYGVPDGWAEGFDEDSLSFGIDFEPYWFKLLGRCFAVAPQTISNIASKVINKDWQLGKYMKHVEDTRAARSIYSYPETSHSHGSYPKVDDLSFYLSYHAMMFAAGELLDTTPLHEDGDDDYYRFSKWISRHDITSCGGVWLSDRRDPFPLKRPNWLLNTDRNDHWRWSVEKADFEQVLIECERLNLWGCWNWTNGHQDEIFSVRSALVTPSHSEALLSSLQTAKDPMDFCVPSSTSEHTIDAGAYQLQGWVVHPEGDLGIDESDPWGANVSYYTPIPSREVQERLELISGDMKVWRMPFEGGEKEVIWGQTWRRLCPRGNDEVEEGGSRLQTTMPCVLSLLNAYQKDMIIEVQIERRLRHRSWEREPFDHQYVPANTRIFLIRQSGKIVSM
ncbi:MAG: hypothetical protein ACSHYA_11805 [Opitutaceae bacterium]